MYPRRLCRLLCLAAFAGSFLEARDQNTVVINEIHHNPDVKTELVEFIELYNRGAAAVDISGWRFSDGVDFTFPSGATVPPGGYAVVAENTNHFWVKFGFMPHGPYLGKLSNEGERIVLLNTAGQDMDEVTYKLGFPWPTVGDAPGDSIELLNPSMDNGLGGSWRSSGALSGPPIASATLINSGSTWRYRKGTNEASNPTTL